MPRLILKTFPVFLLVFFCLFPAEARADTIVITGGSLTASTFNNILRDYTFTGQNFSINARGLGFGVLGASCDACRPGQQITPYGYWVGDSSTLGSGSALINGVSYNRLYFGGTFRFTGDLFTLPVSNDGLVNFTLPFNFEAMLQGCTENTFVTGCPSSRNNEIFSTILRGQGLATFTMSFANGVYAFRSVTYNFQPQPTPEPATMILLSTGLAGVGAYYRRRRRESAGQ